MDVALVVLRLLHVVLGAFWVGAIVFSAVFFMPAVADAGPDGAKVAQAAQRRGLMKVMPIVAIITLLTGVELLRRVSANFEAAWFGSGTGIVYSTGMLAAFAGAFIGFLVMRPMMMRAETLPPAEAVPLRKRALRLNQVVAVLLLVAIAAMAVARYV